MVITTKKSYSVVDNIKQPINCVFMNRLGCWDSVQLTRHAKTDLKAIVTSFNRGRETRVGTSIGDRKITYYSQRLNISQYEWLSDILNIGIVYINGQLVIPVNGSTFTSTNSDDFFTFELVVNLTGDEPNINF